MDENGDPVAGAQRLCPWLPARALPVADTTAGTPLGNTVDIVGGTYDFLVRANGFGLTRVDDVVVSPSGTQTLTVDLKTNLASAANGATASGAGARLGALIDDTEATNWEFTGAPVADQAVIVDLAGDDAHALGSVNVSALLFAGQNRFTALRRFADPDVHGVCPDRLLGVERLRHRVHEPGRRVPVGPAPAARTGYEHPVVRESWGPRRTCDSWC